MCFIGGLTTAIIPNSFYLFDSHSSDYKGLSVNGDLCIVKG